MKKLVLTIALAQMLAISAFAQSTPSTGEADPAQSKARPTSKTTPTERGDARGERRVDGGEAARGPQMGEGESKPAAKAKLSREERRAAAEQRRAANRAANKAGELPRGGSGDAPEMQKPLLSPRP
jgi:hypothetical protein